MSAFFRIKEDAPKTSATHAAMAITWKRDTFTPKSQSMFFPEGCTNARVVYA